MDVSVENTSTLGRRLKISVPDATVKAKIKAKMAKLGREVRLKGFRPGKVPPHVLQQKFGDSVRLEVLNEIIRSTLADELKSKDFHIAGAPTIEEIKNESDQNLEFTASFEVYPQITLADLTQVEINKRVVEITADDVAKMITKLQDQLAHWNPVERSVANGDKLTVDFSRLIKEAGAKQEEQKNVQMEVGAEGVLPGLSEALIGKNKDEQIEVLLRYPDNWADQAAAGKEVDLTITIHEISEKQELTRGELADRLGLEAEEQEKLQDNVRERMQEEVNTALRDELKETVLESLLENNPIELPKALIEQEKEAIRREMSRTKRQDLPKEAVENEETINAAKRRVELGLLLNEVIKKHGIKVDGTKVREQVSKIASKFPSAKEIAEAYYNSKELMYGVERMVLLEQAVDTLLKELKVKETPASFDEVMNPVESTVKE